MRYVKSRLLACSADFSVSTLYAGHLSSSPGSSRSVQGVDAVAHRRTASDSKNAFDMLRCCMRKTERMASSRVLHWVDVDGVYADYPKEPLGFALSYESRWSSTIVMISNK